MSYYGPDDTPDPLHDKLRELLDDRPFVLHLITGDEQPLPDGRVTAGVHVIVNHVGPLQVLRLLHGFTDVMLGEVERAHYVEHAVEDFREQLDADEQVVERIPLAEWVDNARRAAAERHAEVRDVLEDVLPVDADEQRFVPLEGEDGDRG